MTRLSLLFVCLLISSGLIAQEAKVYESLTLKSKILNMSRKYSIYLPAGYEASGRKYPVLYLLHGAGDDETGWVQFGELKSIADKSIREGLATDMIIVMPDANSGKRGYFNTISGDFKYEDFFFKELIPFIETNYRVRAEKRFRAVAGLSMGGGGALIYALHQPEMFAAACPLSAGNGLQEPEQFKAMFQRSNPGLTPEQLDAYYKQHNGIQLVNTLPAEQISTVRWYIDCGDDDPRSESNAKFHAALNAKKVPHEFRINDGGHTWQYWRRALPEVLSFISQSFHQF